MKNLAIIFVGTVNLLLSIQAFAGGKFTPLYPQLVPDSSMVAPPEQTKLMEPGFFAKVSGTQVTLKWAPVENATNYYLQVATDANFWNLIVDNKNLDTTSFEVTGLEKGNHYFWRVYTVKGNNDAGYIKALGVKSMFEVQ